MNAMTDISSSVRLRGPVASSNPLFVVWAIWASADGKPTSWVVAGTAALSLILLIALLPRLTNNLSATPQP